MFFVLVYLWEEQDSLYACSAVLSMGLHYGTTYAQGLGGGFRQGRPAARGVSTARRATNWGGGVFVLFCELLHEDPLPTTPGSSL